MILKNQKVLQMGLGILGGGVATAKFLVERGAKLTVTDMKTEADLKISLEKLKDLGDKIKFVLGEHREKDFLSRRSQSALRPDASEENDIIVVNPDVPVDNKFVKLSYENGKQIENELSLFYRFCKAKNTVGVTGTRGKTTTVNWLAHLLQSQIIGNSEDNPFLGNGLNVTKNLVIEMPSYQLELLGRYIEPGDKKLAPHIAVITNLYRDHINRHKNMEGYALAKANIFKYQTEEDFLVLNKEDEWTDFFVGLLPKARILFFSKNDKFDFIDRAEFIKNWGEHNLLNLHIAVVVAKVLGVTEEVIKDLIPSLPQIKFRQEKIFATEKLQIYNDTTATSPEAAMAAMARFSSFPEDTIFISGGTDRELEYDDWAKIAKKMIKPGNLILLAGSATEKMKMELGGFDFKELDTLEECLKKALEMNPSKIIFSPGAKSFEKFKNEFDRGEQFNLLVNELLK